MTGRATLFASRNWEKQEAGWYTSDIGGICHETDGWAFWPNEMTWPTLRRLPTLGAAMAEADRLARVRAAEVAE